MSIPDFLIKHVVVIGNGFDLDLGLRTSYKDFLDSKEWKEVCSQFKNVPLINFLEEKLKDVNWYDVEAALQEYSLKENEYRHNVDKDRRAYWAICSALRKYLYELPADRNQPIYTKEDSIAKRFLYLFHSGVDLNIYSFNYTLFGALCKNICGGTLSDDEVVYVHRNIKDDNIIFGFDDNKEMTIDSRYRFMIKSHNPAYRSTNIVRDLEKANKVVIFGHSLNDIDSVYFDGYFMSLLHLNNNNYKRKLAIVTKNIDSKEAILNNLENRGLQISRLFQHANIQFFFTKTDNIEKTSEDLDSFININV